MVDLKTSDIVILAIGFGLILLILTFLPYFVGLILLVIFALYIWKKYFSHTP